MFMFDLFRIVRNAILSIVIGFILVILFCSVFGLFGL